MIFSSAPVDRIPAKFDRSLALKTVRCEMHQTQTFVHLITLGRRFTQAALLRIFRSYNLSTTRFYEPFRAFVAFGSRSPHLPEKTFHRFPDFPEI
jgi:hypothetical protein